MNTHLVTPSGKRLGSTDCPQCGAGQDKRINAQPFGRGEPLMCCGKCGHEFGSER